MPDNRKENDTMHLQAREVKGQNPGQISRAPNGIYAKKKEQGTSNKLQMTLPTIKLSWNAIAQQSMYQLPTPTLRPPFSPAQPPFGQLTPPTPIVPPLSPSSSTTGRGPLTLDPLWLLGKPGKSGKQDEKPDTPSRLPLWSPGQFSIGVRIDFPVLEMPEIEGASISSFQESMIRAKFMNQMISGKLPDKWEEIDKGKLVSIIWSIFSTNIAPEVARGIQRKLSVTTTTGKPSYQLDIVILSDFSGGGLSLTGRF